MTKQQLWSLANNQAKQVSNLKNKESRSRQIVLLCQTLKQALKAA